jgi:hypothetical protein
MHSKVLFLQGFFIGNVVKPYNFRDLVDDVEIIIVEI